MQPIPNATPAGDRAAPACGLAIALHRAPIVIHLSDLDASRLEAVAALVAAINPEKAATLGPADHLRFALDLAAEQATDFRQRIGEMHDRCAVM